MAGERVRIFISSPGDVTAERRRAALVVQQLASGHFQDNIKPHRIMAHAKVETDKTDAGVLAQLCAGGFRSEVWIADEPTAGNDCGLRGGVSPRLCSLPRGCRCTRME